jgi:hypothetical protein
VTRITAREARLSHRHKWLHDLKETDFERANELVMDDKGEVNLSDSDEDATQEKFY